MHDPMAAFPPELPEPADPWAALAEQARAMADLADLLATKSAGELAPTDDANPLEDLRLRALDIGGTVAACKRAALLALRRDEGLTLEEVGSRWGGISKQAVRKALLTRRPESRS